MDVVNVEALNNILNSKELFTHNNFALYIIETFTEYSHFAHQAHQPVYTLYLIYFIPYKCLKASIWTITFQQHSI